MGALNLAEQKSIYYYGKVVRFPERLLLNAGPLSMIFEAGDLRIIKYDGREILRRIYVAIRDRNWGTVSPVIRNIEKEIRQDSFRLVCEVENRQGDIHFAWRGEIQGDKEGRVSFTMEGEAKTTFFRNRIGFCVLHPAGCAGAACQVLHVDGTKSRAELPLLISPDQPVPPFSEMSVLSHQVEPGLWAEVQFQGEVFEMEDQRNWTDASFKTFGTPLHLPYPVKVEQGTRLSQAVRLRVIDERKTRRQARSGRLDVENALTLGIKPGAVPLPLPPVGLGCASHGFPLSEKELSRLRALCLDHLRVDLSLADEVFDRSLDRAVQEARNLGLQLDIALSVSTDSEEPLRYLARRVVESRIPVRTWLIFPDKKNYGGGSSTAQVVEMVRKHLEGVVPGAKFSAGTNYDLIFLLRNPPPVERIDLVTFAINPQVHAFDIISLVETLEAQAQAVHSARRFCTGLPVMVSPVTLKMRSNPYSTDQVPVQWPGEIPPQVDVRQVSLFGAGWTLGSLSSLAQSGVASLTYFETTGWRGVIEREDGSPMPDQFPSIAGGVYPMYFVFAALREFAGGEVIPSQTSHPQEFNGLVLRKGKRQRILVANHTPDSRAITIPNLGKRAELHRLDENNVEDAMRRPENFLELPGEVLPTSGKFLKFTWLPFSFCWIDF
jgi:hypothetical protein